MLLLGDVVLDVCKLELEDDELELVTGIEELELEEDKPRISRS
jgi:hypothetical protein